MNWIEKMIAEQCPNGVEKVKVKDTFPRLKGTPITAGLMKEIQKESAPITIFAGGRTIIKAFESDIPKANIITKASVIVQSRGVIDVQFCNTPFTFKNEMWAYTHSNVTSVKYLYYYLKQNIGVLRQRGAEHGSMPQISLTATENMQISLPSLSIQKEIVSVLDKFSELIEKTDEEIALRQKQYEYYREKLLTFEKGEVRMVKMGEVALDIFSGATPSTKEKSYWENGTIRWMSSGDVHLGQVREVEGRITQLGYDKCSTKMVPENSVVIALAGQGKTRGTVAITRIPLCTNQSLCAVVPNTKLLFPNFLFYYLKGQYLNLRIISSGDGTRGGLNLKMIRSFEIPLPSKVRQQEIVATLDKFEALISKLKEERELRQKQYEYYREKLLTF